jgi:hypothetical protein
MIVTIVLSVIILGLAIILLSGHGFFLIAGFNTMSKDEKEKYDTVALCKFIGKILFPMGLLTPFLAICSELGVFTLFPIVYCCILVGLAVFACIYTSTKNRFKR